VTERPGGLAIVPPSMPPPILLCARLDVDIVGKVELHCTFMLVAR